MNLWRLIRASVYSPAFYRGLAEKSNGFSIRYFYVVGLGFAVAFSAILSFRAIPLATTFLDQVGDAIVAAFPEDLVVTVKSGEASVNVPEPFFLPMPEALRDGRVEGVPLPPGNILTIDTSAEASAESFNRFDTAVLLTRDALLWKDARGRITIEPLLGMPDGTVDKKFIAAVTGELASLGRWLAPVIVFGSFFFFLAIYSFLLLACLALAVAPFIIARSRGIPVDYATSYRIALHATTLPVFLNLVIGWGIPGSPATLFSGVVFLLVLLFNLRARENGEPKLDTPGLPPQIP